MRRRRAGLTDAGRAAVTRDLALWSHLAASEQEVLLERTDELLVRKTWEGARGFALDEERRALLAALAAVPVMALGVEEYRLVSSVVVHPSTIHVPHASSAVALGGALTSVYARPLPVHGLASPGRGPVVLAWDQVLTAATRTGAGSHVVVHELAHKLDMNAGGVDGTPRLSRALRREWVEECQRVYDDLVRGVPHPPIGWYAATSPGEFFAVVSEVFFEQGALLAVFEPRLYALLRDFYGQDPAAREPLGTLADH